MAEAYAIFRDGEQRGNVEIEVRRAEEYTDDVKLLLAQKNVEINNLQQELAYAQRRIAELEAELAEARA
jgi:hypothetical protein